MLAGREDSYMTEYRFRQAANVATSNRRTGEQHVDSRLGQYKAGDAVDIVDTHGHRSHAVRHFR